MSERNLNEQGELKRTLNLPLLVGFGLAYLAPTVVFNSYGIWTVETGGHYPLALLITTILMTVTAYSYTRMTKVYPIAGSAYTFVHKSVNSHLGFMTGWVMLLDYMLLPMICFLLIGIYVNLYFPTLPVWLVVIVVVGIAACINIIGAKMASIVDTIIIIAQLAFTAFTVILCCIYVVGNGDSLIQGAAIYNPETFEMATTLKAAACLCCAFVGFDAVTTMAEETKNPDKIMTPAIMIVCVGAGIMFFITSYAVQIAWPEAHTSIVDPDSGVFEFFPAIGKGYVADIFFVVDNFASFVCAMAAVAAASRILYGMGRDNILPKKVFGYINPKFNTPVYNLIIISIVSCSAILYADNLLGASELISFGVIVGFVMVNLSVIFHYYIRGGQRKGAKNKIMYLIVPAFGMIILIGAFLFIGNGAKILGGIWTVLGIIYLAFKTKGFKELPPEMHLE